MIPKVQQNKLKVKIPLKIISLIIIYTFINGCSKYSKEEITINFGIYAEDSKYFESVIKLFEKEKNIRVKIESIPGIRYQDKIKTEIASGTAPDVFVWDDEPFLALVSRDSLLCLDSFIKEDKYDLTDFFPQAVKSFEYKGKIYGIPMDAGAEVIFFNKDIFDKCKIPYPSKEWTWMEFIKTAQLLTKYDEKTKKISQYGYMPTYGWWPQWLAWVWQAGGDLLNSDRTKCIIASPKAIRGLEFYADLALKYKVSPASTVENESGSGMSVSQLFETGRIAMFGGLPVHLRNFKKVKSIRWDLCQYPKGPAGLFTRFSSCPYVIYKNTKYPKYAWELVKFLASQEIEKKLVEFYKFPVRKSTAYSNEYLEIKNGYNPKVFLDAITVAKVQPLVPEFDEMGGIIQLELDKVILGKQTCKEAAENIQQKVNVLLSKGMGRQ